MNSDSINRASNNRESLQSRLLERITNKNQRSPQEIYLEEELSSDEEDETVQDNEDEMETERQKSVQHVKEEYDEDNAADIEDQDVLETDKECKTRAASNVLLKSINKEKLLAKVDDSYKDV